MPLLPGRPKVFRDPIHGDIAFPRDDFGTLILRLIDTRTFQRLRGIRQNGVMNFVFPGAEHSRFTHSLGVAHVAAMMFDAITRNNQMEQGRRERQQTIIAALLHDLGHGPFSHALEEITEELGEKKYDHEGMTRRLITEPASEVRALLAGYDPEFPAALSKFFDKKIAPADRRWYYQIVSSQLDADRIDYLLRDAHMAGVRHSFDHKRLVESIGQVDNAIVVDQRAFDVAESYLLAIDQMYEAIYFHKTVRAASILLTQTLKRAWMLARESAERMRMLFPLGDADPLAQLFRSSDTMPPEQFASLDEHHIWHLLSMWRADADATLRDLVGRVYSRRFMKPLTLEKFNFDAIRKIEAAGKELVRKKHPELDPEYYVNLDEPERVSYRRYALREGPHGAIQILTNAGPKAIEEMPRSIATQINAKIARPRFIVHEDVRAELADQFKGVL